MLKKFFIVLSGIFVLTFVLYVIYAFILNPSEVTEKLPKSEFETITKDGAKDGAPQGGAVSSGNVAVLSDQEAVSLWLAQDGISVMYIERTTGNIYQLHGKDGTRSVLLETKLPNVVAAIWPKNAQYVIVKSMESTLPSYWLFDLRSSQPIKLKSGIEYIAWDTLSEKILYVYKDASGVVSLNVADPNGSNWRELLKLGAGRFVLSAVPQSPVLSFWEYPGNTRPSSLKTISLVGAGEVKPIFSGKYGADYLWSPNGNRVLVSSAPEKNGSRMSLAVMNAQGGEYRDIQFSTMVSKCTWSSDNVTVYCAIPVSVPVGMVMPDEYDAMAFFTQDVFWKINTLSGASERVVELENLHEGYDATNLVLSQDESMLFFINRKDNRPYKIAL